MLNLKKLIVTLAVSLTALSFTGVNATEVKPEIKEKHSVLVSYNPDQIIIKMTKQTASKKDISDQIDAIIMQLEAAE